MVRTANKGSKKASGGRKSKAQEENHHEPEAASVDSGTSPVAEARVRLSVSLGTGAECRTSENMFQLQGNDAAQVCFCGVLFVWCMNGTDSATKSRASVWSLSILCNL